MSMFPRNSKIRHRNGSVYEVLLLPTDALRVEATQELAYAYWSAKPKKGAERTIWIRPQTEVEDGRFTLVTGE